MDILWNGEQLLVAGPDTSPVRLTLQAGTQIVGLRFAPGAGGALLGVPASALCDARVPLAELWGDAAHALEAELHQTRDVDATRRALEQALLARRAQAATHDALLPALLQWLQPSAAKPDSVAELAARAGVAFALRAQTHT